MEWTFNLTSVMWILVGLGALAFAAVGFVEWYRTRRTPAALVSIRRRWVPVCFTIFGVACIIRGILIFQP